MDLARTLLGVLPGELEAWLASRGERPFRARQILRWVHGRGIVDPAEMTDLPAATRELLREQVPASGASLASWSRSADGTRKLTVALADRNVVESVLIPDEGKLTQCVSTQVGCAYGCAFCRSGSRGLVRGLSADEILAQIQLGRSRWDPGERLSNVVLMGSGEPLANYVETARSLTLMTSERAMDLSSRRVTVSTVGLPAGIARLGRDFGGAIGLAVSLHGPDDATRRALVRSRRAPRLDAVVEALRAYPLPHRRRITVEYVLAAGVNDRPEQAAGLARLLRGLRVKVNLIPLNAHGLTDLEAPSPDAVEAFRGELVGRNLTALVRKERGVDIEAACGQLAAWAVASDG